MMLQTFVFQFSVEKPNVFVFFKKKICKGTDVRLTIIVPKIKQILQVNQIHCHNGFKKSIRKWIPADCPCRFCRAYIIYWSEF